MSDCEPSSTPEDASGPDLSILLAHENGLLVETLALHLEREPGFRVIAQCRTGDAAVKAARRWRPTAAIVASAMPDLPGSVVTRAILDASPHTFVIALASNEACGNVAAMLLEGACGFLPVACKADDVIDTLKGTAMTNGAARYFKDTATPPCLPTTGNPACVLPPPPRCPASIKVSKRQHTVLRWMAKGQSRKQIADKMKISKHTVNTHCRQLMEKLGGCAKEELSLYAYANYISRKS